MLDSWVSDFSKEKEASAVRNSWKARGQSHVSLESFFSLSEFVWWHFGRWEVDSTVFL
ncbi:hypothetical protein LPTSP3_g37300 [Leptospira kobayashii]|uniref:Uncharacterized protein n=1 Tax=Leptospira kobayashii TaxID=1917830 RepID=A0ABN6KIZ4_9LEPT|nr:hypothetical protein [Leptospira kobayashii]BDA80800.1 hypothetical protein LPTSP3_g37300 [Leptospira kobayashii]